MRIVLVAFLAYVGFTAGLWSQASYSLTLEQAIDFALENNRQAQNASRDVEAAYKQKWEVTAAGLPQINADINYQNYLVVPQSLIPAEFFGGAPGEFTPVIFSPKQSVIATGTLEQLIFDGSYIVGLQSAQVFLEISKNAKTKTDLEVRKAVIQSYGNVLLAAEGLRIIEQNLATVGKNLEETKKFFENGIAEEESVEQLQVTYSNLLNSKNYDVRFLDIAKKYLNLSLGIDINVEVELLDNLEKLTQEKIDFILVEQPEDLANNIDYQIALNTLKSDSLLLKLARSKALPTLRGFINAGYQGFNQDFDFLQREQDWFGSSAFGVSLKVPIFSSLQRHAATQRAKIELINSQNELTETEQQLRLDIEQAKTSYRFAIDNYNVSKENLALAERIERKNQVKYFEGISSSFDLRQAQIQLYDSQRQYLEAMVDIINRKTELETLLNTNNLIPINN